MIHPAADLHGSLDPVSILHAIERNLTDWYRALAAMMPGTAVIEEADHTRVMSSIAHPACNAVLHARFEHDRVVARIRTIVDEYSRLRLPALWWIGPGSRPVDQHAHLVSAGLEPVETLHGMAADLQCIPDQQAMPAGWTTEVVAGPEQMRDWVLPFADAFTMRGSIVSRLAPIGNAVVAPSSPIRLYLGRLDGEPVSCAALLMGPSVAGLYYVGTRARARRRGCATALASLAMLHARNAGYRLCVLHSSPLSVDLYRRLGYMEYCRLRTLILKPTP